MMNAEATIHNVLMNATFHTKLKMMNHKKTNPNVKKLIRKSLFTPKQEEVLRVTKQPDLQILVHHGGTGSGKTFINNYIFVNSLLEVRKEATRTRGPNFTPICILAGYKQENLINNIVMPLEDNYGLTVKFDKNGNFNLFGVKVVTTFLNSPRGEASIRGLDAWFIYVNEATTANRSAFDELGKRMRGGKKPFMIMDTNPSHPLHWLKTDYIDRSYTADDIGKGDLEGKTKGLYSVHSTPYDNPFLEDSYIEYLNNQPEGASKQRSLGYWTTGSGAVYSHFNPEYHYIQESDVPKRTQFTDFFIGVDWGWVDPTVFLLFGKAHMKVKKYDDDGNEYEDYEERVFLLKEVHKTQTHMEYWQSLAQDWMKEYGRYVPFYCDSAEQDRIDKLREVGANVQNADKNIDLGIESVSKLIEEGVLLIVEDNVRYFKNEINTYEWDEKKGKPVDKDNHVMDSLRYAIHTHDSSRRRGVGFY